MISMIILITTLFIAGGWLLMTRENRSNPKWLVMPILIATVGLLVSFFQPYSLDRVDAGHIGLKVNLTGDSRGVSDYQYKTGWVVYNDWTENFYEFPTFQQHIDYDSVNVITKGGFSATIKPSFNYNLVSTAVGDMFVNLRLDIKSVEQGWLKTAIIGSVNDVANKWAVDDIFNQREQFETAIVAECNKRVSKWFTVSQLRTNITPPPALQASIIQKTQAIQNAQAKLQEVIVADADAKKKIAIARGDSAQVVIKANGDANALLITARAEADAMKLKQQQLSAVYVEYLKASNWNGVLPTTVLGNGTPMINIK